MSIRPIILLSVFVLIIINLLSPVLSYAQAEKTNVSNTKNILLPDKFSLQKLIDQAFANNPKLKAAKKKWEAVIEQYPQVTSYEDPVLKYSYFVNKVETRVGPQRQKISFSQKIPFPGKLSLKGEVVSHKAKIAQIEFERETRDLIVELKTSYYELAYINKAIEVVRKNKDLAEHLVKVGTADFSVDGTTLNDVFKAQSQLAQLSYDLILLTELKETEEIHINAIINSPTELPIGIFDELLSVTTFPYTLDDLYRLFKINYHELNIFREKIEKSKTEVMLARKDYMPDFSLGLSYIDTGDANAASMGTVPADSGKDAYSVNFGITIPLWFGKKKSRVNEAKLKQQEMVYLKKDLENRRKATIKMIYFKFQNSKRLIELYKNSLIPQAEQSMEIAETWYKEKKGSFSGLLEARSVWLNFQLAQYRALADYHQRIAGLEKLTGVVLDSYK